MNYIDKILGIKYINDLLKNHIRDFYSYNKIIGLKLGIKRNIPIFIDDKNVYLPIKAFKAYDCMWINYCMIKTYEKYGKNVLIVFIDGEIKEFNITYNKLEIIITKAKKVMDFFRKIEL